MVFDRNRLLHVALRHGDATAVKVLNGADGLELGVVRYNVAPQAHAAACIVLHLAEVLRVKQRCNVIRNLVEHAHDLIGREIRALFVCNAYERVDVGQHARLVTDTVERELTRLDRLFKLGLRVVRVDVVLAGVGRVGHRTVDRARA